MGEQHRVTRRGAIMGTTLAAAAASIPMVPAAARPPQFRAVNNGSGSALMAKRPGDIQAQLGNVWVSEKKRLLNTRQFAFLQPFAEDLCVDQIVYDEVSALQAAIPPYDPLQVETLCSATSALLDRCLSNRREMYDMEEQAIRRALEYDLFNNQYTSLLNIELADYVEKQRSVEQAGQNEAVTHFKAAIDPMAHGFGAMATGAANSAGIAMSGEVARKQAVTAKWQALKTYQLALQARHNTPGCSLNYAERYGRLEQLLRQDIRVAYQKLRCIEAGLNHLFGLSVKLPPPQSNGYLDVMVMFLRGAIEAAGLATLEEIDFVHVVSLHQNVHLNGSNAQLIADAGWKASFEDTGTGIISFQLNNEFPSAVKMLRVRAVGASVLFKDTGPDILGPANRTAEHLRRASVIVFPPQVPDLFAPGSLMDRPPVPIGNATWLDPSDMKLVAAAAAGNIDPRVGTWRIQVSTSVQLPDNTVSSLGSISEVKLHLSLSALVDKSVAPWPSFT